VRAVLGAVAAVFGWAGERLALVVLLPLSATLVWAAVWKVWLPIPDGGVPSRRSVTLAIVLLVLGVGSAVIGVFHNRLKHIELTRTGLTVTLTAPERSGLGALVERLARTGASPARIAEATRRYLEAVHVQRPALHPIAKALLAEEAGLSVEQAEALAERIASAVG